MESEVTALSNINDIFQSLIVLTKAPFGWAIISFMILMLAWLFINKDINNLFLILERKEKNRIEKINEFISSERNKDKNISNIMNDLHDAYYFKSATGIYAEDKLRNHLIKLHESTSHKVTWSSIKLSLPYINISETGEIKIREMDAHEKISFTINTLVGFILLACAFSLVIFMLIDINKSLENILNYLMLIIVSVIISMIAFSQNWPIQAAKKINKEIKAHNNEKV